MIPAQQIEAVRQVFEMQPVSVERIANDFRMSPRTIRKLARTNGWKRQQPPRRGGVKPGHRKPDLAATIHRDAREAKYSPELLAAIKTLQRNDFAVYRIKGDLFMCGTKRVHSAAILDKARRYA